METIACPWEPPQDLSWCQHWLAALEETQRSWELRKEQEGLAATARSQPQALRPAAACWGTALGDLIRHLPCFARDLQLPAFKPRPRAVVLTWAVLWPCLCLARGLPPWPQLANAASGLCLVTATFSGDLWRVAALFVGHGVTGPHWYRQGPASLATNCSSRLASPGQASPSRCPQQRLT